MQFSRRAFLASGAAVMAAPVVNAPIVNAMTLGQMQIQTVSDGSLVLPGEFIFGPMPQDELAPILQDYNQPMDRLTPECNLTLVRHQGRVILFDVGSGQEFVPTAGELETSLDALDLTVDDITDVVFTHGHPDHLWGLLDDFGDPLFMDAQYHMGQREFDYWMNPNTVDEIGDARAAFAVGAKRRLEVVADQVTFFKDGDEILPSIAARASFGHSPGHMAFELRDGNTSAMVLGDAIGNHHVAFARPDWVSGSDQDPEMAVATRLSLFDQITAAKMPVVGFHLPNGGMGHVDTHGDGYRFIAGDL